MPVAVEICVDSVASAVAAAEGGADRVELCANLPAGGVTPSAGLIAAVRRRVDVPVHVMIRPRAGDFCYSPDELDVMLADIAWARKQGAAALVLGVLDAAGAIDRPALMRLLAAARSCPVTFHRAFDVVPDPQAALDELRSLGVGWVLTSGQAASAPQGAGLLAALAASSPAGPRIMAGAGVTPQNVAALVACTGVRDVHLQSAVTRRAAGPARGKGRPAMGSDVAQDELRVVDHELVRAVRAAVDALPAPG